MTTYYTTQELMKLTDTELESLMKDEFLIDNEGTTQCRATMIEKLSSLYSNGDSTTGMSLSNKFPQNTWRVSFDRESWYEVDPLHTHSKEALFHYVCNGGAYSFLKQWTEENQTSYDDNDRIDIYLGRVEPFKVQIQVPAILKEINQKAWEHSGGFADGFLMNVSNELQSELQTEMNTMINKWLDTHNLLYFATEK